MNTMTAVPVAPWAVREIATDVHDTACAALSAAGQPAGRSVVVLGPEPWDNCCEGILAVQIIRWFPLVAMFEQQFLPTRCPAGFAIQLDVMHAMCAPAVLDNGAPPSATDVTNSSWVALELGWRITAALQNLVNDWAKIERRSALLGDWLPLGPDGGCQGGRLSMTVEMTSGLVIP